MFEDLFTNIEPVPTHPDLKGTIASQHLIPAVVANRSSLLQTLAATTDAEGNLLYEHNNMFWNGVWLPEDRFDALVLGFAQHGGAAISPLYLDWVESLLNDIEAEQVAREAELIASGYSAAQARQISLEEASGNVKGLQNFISMGLVVSSDTETKQLQPALSLREDDSSALLQYPVVSPQELYGGPTPKYDYEYIKSTLYFKAGQLNETSRNLEIFNPVATTPSGSLQDVIARALVTTPEYRPVYDSLNAATVSQLSLATVVDPLGGKEPLITAQEPALTNVALPAGAAAVVAGVATAIGRGGAAIFSAITGVPSSLPVVGTAYSTGAMASAVVNVGKAELSTAAILTGIKVGGEVRHGVTDGYEALGNVLDQVSVEDTTQWFASTGLSIVAYYIAASMFGPAGAIAALFLTSLPAIPTFISALAKTYPDSPYLVELEAEMNKFLSFISNMDSHDVKNLFLLTAQAFFGDGDDVNFISKLDSSTAAISKDGGKFIGSDEFDIIMQSGPGTVYGGGGNDAVFVTVDTSKTPESTEDLKLDDIYIDGGPGVDHVIISDEFIQLQNLHVRYLDVNGGEGNDLVSYGDSTHPIVVYAENIGIFVVYGKAERESHLIENVENIILSESMPDDLILFSLNTSKQGEPITIDAAGQEDKTGDRVDASRMESGVVIELQQINAQFVIDRNILKFELPEVANGISKGRIGELFQNAGVYNGLRDAVFDEIDVQPVVDNLRLNLAHFEHATGSDFDDVIFGPDDIRLNSEKQYDRGLKTNNKTAPIDPEMPEVTGSPQSPILEGMRGDDTIIVGREAALVDGGAGNDLIIAGKDSGSRIYGGKGDDIIITRGSPDKAAGSTIYGGDGNDTIYAAARNSFVYGGEGDDTFFWAEQVRILDAEPFDHLSFFGIPVVGGVGTTGIGEAMKWVPMVGFMQLNFGINPEGDLVIRAFNDKEMFVANYVGGPGISDPTLGIHISVLESGAFLAVQGVPALPGREDWLGAFLREWSKSIDRVDFRDPLVLDLDGDGIETTTTITDSPSFDLDGDAFAERTGWLLPDDGFLVRDLNDNGLIDDMTEWFGQPGQPGFAHLAELDGNGDLIIDALDPGFAELKIWRDFDQDAVTDVGELLTLEAAGITGLSLSAQEMAEVTSTGHNLVAVSSFTRSDGTTGGLYELLFDADQYNSTYVGAGRIAPWAQTLPEVKGYGQLTDLRVAASNDVAVADALMASANRFATADIEVLRDDFRAIAHAWVRSNPETREIAPVKLREDPSGTVRLDYAQYIEDANGGYWQLASGQPLLDGAGNVIDRPQLADFATAATAPGESWQLQQIWSANVELPADQQPAAGAPLPPIYSYRQATAYLVDENGRVLDYAVADAGGNWRLASGNPVLDASGNVIAAPSLQNILNQTAPEGQTWRLEAFGEYTRPDPAQEFAVVWLDDKIRDYAVFVEPDNVWVSAAKLIEAIRYGREIEAEYQYASLADFSARYRELYADVDRIEVHNVKDLAYAAILGGVELDEIASLKAGRDAQGKLEYGYSISYQADALQQVIERADAFQTASAIRIAAQTGLKDYFELVPYDPVKDVFHPTTPRELTPLFEQIFANAPAGEAAALQWLENWRPIIQYVVTDFEPNVLGDVTVGYLFSNIVAAFESTGIALDIYQVAEKLGVPAEDIRFDTTDGATVAGTDGDDLFYLSTGNQTFTGGAGHDSYIVGRDFGQDVIDDLEPALSRKSADTLRFADYRSDEITASRDGQDLILTVTATGDSLRIKRQFEGPLPGLFGGDFSDDTGISEIIFADGVVWGPTDWAFAVSRSAPTDDAVIGTSDIDVLDGGAGTDFLSGGRSSDVYKFDRGYGQDRIEENNDNLLAENQDFVFFGENLSRDDLTFLRLGTSNDLLIKVKDSADQLTITNQFAAFNSVFFGVQWMERIEYFLFDDGQAMDWQEVLKETLANAKTDGDDGIYGYYYRDRLDGGAGNDYLSGADEGDTYLFGRGYGRDVIEDNLTNVLTLTDDQLEFLPDIAPEDIALSRSSDGYSLIMSVKDSNDQVTLLNQFDATYTLFGLVHFDRIESFNFTDGSGVSWSYDYVRRQLLQQSITDGDDVIEGFEAADEIDGLAGNDILKGGAFSDTYYFGRGSGNDIIREDAGFVLFEDFDRVVFRDLNLSDLSVSRGATSLIFTINDTGETLTIEDQFVWLPHFVRQWYAVEEFVFADGTVLTLDDFAADKLALTGSDEADQLTGSDFGEEIIGGRGDDLLQGGGGGDTYYYNAGDGSDIIYDRQSAAAIAGDDRLVFGDAIAPTDLALARDGEDLLITIAGQSGVLRIQSQFGALSEGLELFEFADGTVWTAADVKAQLLIDASSDGDEILVGFADRPNIFDPRAGNDEIHGAGFSDSYVFGLGYGFDTIFEVAETEAEPGAVDRVLFDELLSPQDLAFSRDGSDLLVTISASGDQLRVKDGLGSAQIERFEFADNSALTFAEIKQLLLTGTVQPDLLIGYDDSDDRLDGAAGNDALQGGLGSDFYVFNIGYGQDSIFDTGGALDVVEFGAFIDPQATRFARDDDNLVITFDGFADNLAVLGAFASPAQVVEEFRFANGLTLSFDEVQSAMIAASATDGDDLIAGFAGRDDVLDGGPGNDVLRGGTGSDLYNFSPGGGRDVVADSGGAADQINVLGYTSAEVRVERLAPNSDDVRLSFNDGADEIIIEGGLSEANPGAIEKITFKDFVTWTPADLRAKVTEGAASSGNDLSFGFAGADELAGGAGDDLLQGFDGSDTYRFSRGDGFDIIDDNGSFDTDRLEIRGYGVGDLRVTRFAPDSDDLLLSFQNSDDRILLKNGLVALHEDQIEQVAFGDGTVLTAAELRDLLQLQPAGEGRDQLTGGPGDDVLEGHGGDDFASGGDGSDRYIFRRGDGRDVIEDNGLLDNDRIEIKGYLPSEVEIRREEPESATLVINFIGTDDQIRVRNTLDENFADGIEAIVFDDGTVWSMADLRGRLLAQGSNGFAGADTLDARQLQGAASGLDGSDTYIFTAGDGRLEIIDNGFLDTDRLALRGIDPADVKLARDVPGGATLIMTFAGSADEIRLIDTLSGSAQNTIEEIHFDDGTVWQIADVIARLDASDPGFAEQTGGFGADIMQSTSPGIDVLHGGFGGDT